MRQLLIVMLVLAGWEALARLGLLNPVIIGSPSLVFAAAVKDGPAFLSAFGITAYEMLLAAAMACVGGVAVGAVVGAQYPQLARVLAGVLRADRAAADRALPRRGGLDRDRSHLQGHLRRPRRILPIALATVSGIRSIDLRYAELARALGATRRQIVTQVMLRLALPAVLSGLRVGLSLVIISVVQSEMLSSVAGLGFLISYHRSLFNVGQVYLGIMLVLLVAAAGNFAVSALERRFGRRPSLLQAAA